jgi:hypothetical protein
MSKKNDNKIDIVVNDDINASMTASRTTTIRSLDSHRKIGSKQTEIPAISGWTVTDKQIITEIVVEDIKKTATYEKGRNTNKSSSNIIKNDDKKVDQKDEKSIQTTVIDKTNESPETSNNTSSNSIDQSVNDKMKKLFLKPKNKKRKYILITAALVTIPILICLIILLLLFAFGNNLQAI